MQSFGQLFILLIGFLLCLSTSLSAANPHSAIYSPQTDRLLWFIQASDSHIGASGTKDSANLQWLVGDGKTFIQPSFIVVTGDLTDSTNGNIFGYPNGPFQAEWDQYKSILSSNGITRQTAADFYFDLPGNHDAYNDKNFTYLLANSIQGKTQVSWTRTLGLEKYLFIGTNTAGNTGSKFSFSYPYGDYAGLDTTELDFIGQQLSANGNAALTLIFGHHPLAPTGDSTDTYLSYGRDELVSYMNSYRASLYGYGHTHVSSESFYTQGMTEGVFYFNVSALGKDSPNQYTVTAIDCNGISSVTQNVNTWPVVLITAPLHQGLGGVNNPYAYTVTNSSNNPIRALVFDRLGVTGVQFRVNGGTTWYPMSNVAGNPKLWQGLWDASNLSAGEYTIEVQATTGSGKRSDTITTIVSSTKANQTIGPISFDPPSLAVSGTTTAIATASSGLPVSFSSLTASICTVSGSTVIGATAGTCTVAANQAGNNTYNPAPQVTKDLTVNAVSVAMSVTPNLGLTSTGIQGGPFSPGSASYTVVNTGGAPINWTASKTQPWVTLSSTSSTLAAGASTTMTVSINSGANSLTVGGYSDSVIFTNTTNEIGNATRRVSLTVGKLNQTIGSISFNPTSLAVGGATTASATASSGLTVSFSSLTPGICTVSGSTVTGVAAGTCAVAADQAGDSTYNPAPQVTQSLTVGAASSSIMHLGAITVTKGTSWIFRRGISRVQIVDANNAPVQGAVVSGQWSGGATDSDTFTSGADGWGSATSNWGTSNGTFTFCVTAVSKTGWSYQPGLTCGSTP
jgi:hypothetical protein